MYLAISKLKGFVSEKRILQYKNIVHNDPYLVLWKKRSDLILSELNSKKNFATGDTLRTLQIAITLGNITKIKSSFFINKIDKI